VRETLAPGWPLGFGADAADDKIAFGLEITMAVAAASPRAR